MCKHPTLSSFIEYNLCSLQISTHQGNKVIKIRFYWPSRIHFFFQKLEVFTWIIISWRFYIHILYKNSFCTISSKWISFLEDKLDLQLHQDILDECICPTVLKGTVTVLFIFTYKIFCFLACNCHTWNVTTNSKTCNTALCAFRSMLLCLWKEIYIIDILHYRKIQIIIKSKLWTSTEIFWISIDLLSACLFTPKCEAISLCIIT